MCQESKKKEVSSKEEPFEEKSCWNKIVFYRQEQKQYMDEKWKIAELNEQKPY